MGGLRGDQCLLASMSVIGMLRHLTWGSRFGLNPLSKYGDDLGKVRSTARASKSAVGPRCPFHQATVNPVGFAALTLKRLKCRRRQFSALDRYRHAPTGVVECFYFDAGTVLPFTIAVRGIPLLQPTQFVGHVNHHCAPRTIRSTIHGWVLLTGDFTH